MSEIAAEFVRLKVDVILTAGTAATLAAKQATSIIPVVFTTVADPVEQGWSGVFHDPEAISPAYRTSRRKLPANKLHCWARLFLICAG